MNIIASHRNESPFALVGQSAAHVVAPHKACGVFFSRMTVFLQGIAAICAALAISASLAAQDSEPAKTPVPAESKPTPAAAQPAAAPAATGPSDQQMEKLATESEKEAADAEKKAKADKIETKTTDKKESADGDVKPAKGKAGKKSRKDKEKEKAGTFQPDFRDQEIQDILKLFSKIIGKNIIADEKVKGKITVISPYKIPRSLAYPYLYSMLAIKGFGIVEENETLIRVVALKDALAGSPLIFLGRDEIKDTNLRADLPVTQIMPVLGTKPSRLSGILKRVTSANTDLVDYDDVGMLIVSGNLLEVNRVIRVTNMIDYKGTAPDCDKKDPDCGFVRPEGGVHVYRLENMHAENVEATLKKVQLPIDQMSPLPSAAHSTSGGAASSSTPAPSVSQANVQRRPIDVVAHKETNSIIYVGTADEFELVKGLIKRIDLPRQQVLLEVLIVEVGTSANRSLGIDWIAGQGDSAQFNSGIASSSGLIDTTTGTFKSGAINTSSGFSVTFLNNSVSNIIGILNAQVSSSNFTVVSAPQVLTLDNQEAEINVGQDVPVRVNSFTSMTGSLSQSYEYRPVGVKLKFTPQVNKNGMVTLNLFQEVKTLVPAADPLANPTISKKDVKTYVRVQDAQTIVIGGLVGNNRQASIVKVPILGDFPLIGYLFRRTTITVTRSNLMVFITPHILTNRAIADKVTSDVREEQIRENKRGTLD